MAPTTPNETLRIGTSWFQQSIRYCLERKTTAPHTKHWHSFNIHPLDSIFPQHRRGRFQLFNVFNSSRCFTQGLLQGSVLSPLLFLFYINDLVSSLKDGAVIALFADDISILTTPRKKQDAEAATQSVVNSVVILSHEWKLNLNADECEVCPFSA